MMTRTGKLILAAAVALAAAGCNELPRRTTNADRVMQRIDDGYYRTEVPPTSLIETGRRLLAVGEDVRVTVRIMAPCEDQALDPYLPIRGRLHVRAEGALTQLSPLAGAERLAWAEIPVDHSRKRERSFSLAANRIFPMTRTGWYFIWWEGVDDLGHAMNTGEVPVRVMITVPSRGD